MPIQILQDDEKLIYTMAGSKIFYRRISTLKRGSIVRRHTKRGKTDWNAVTTDILMVVILGWEAVQVKGEDVPFDADLALKLPEDVLSEILALSGGAGDDGDNGDTEKN